VPFGLDFSSVSDRGVDKTDAADGNKKRAQKTKLKVFCSARFGQRPFYVVWVANAMGRNQGGFALKIVYPVFGTKLGLPTVAVGDASHRLRLRLAADRRWSIRPVTMDEGKGSEVRQWMNHCTDP
jgi:hypothetical protein